MKIDGNTKPIMQDTGRWRGIKIIVTTISWPILKATYNEIWEDTEYHGWKRVE